MVRYAGGDVFRGDILDGRRHGEGSLWTPLPVGEGGRERGAQGGQQQLRLVYRGAWAADVPHVSKALLHYRPLWTARELVLSALYVSLLPLRGCSVSLPGRRDEASWLVQGTGEALDEKWTRYEVCALL